MFRHYRFTVRDVPLRLPPKTIHHVWQLEMKGRLRLSSFTIIIDLIKKCTWIYSISVNHILLPNYRVLGWKIDLEMHQKFLGIFTHFCSDWRGKFTYRGYFELNNSMPRNNSILRLTAIVSILFYHGCFTSHRSVIEGVQD